MPAKPEYQDITLPIEKRVDDLVWRMTLEEKASQMVYGAPSIERLGVPKYNWWNECLHGVGRAGDRAGPVPSRRRRAPAHQ